MSTTTDLPHLVYRYDRDERIRIVHDPATGVWGCGATPLDALRDYLQAVRDHCAVGDPNVTE